mmetsp:Transcript_9382/g.14036  ORF Transcript_9382/g.14036 Transcript_9382/m.14036 type:complete len:281 (-) Transcript_9382:95-937(-)
MLSRNKRSEDESLQVYLPFETTSFEAKSRSTIKECLKKNYRDHSNEAEDSYRRGNHRYSSSISKGGVIAPFPYKLFDLLEHIDKVEPELSHIIAWLPHGRSFLVHKPHEFIKLVLPRFFNQKYASFQRQLNLYGFCRITRDCADKNSYYHECFLRRERFLCQGIIRIKINGVGARRPSNPESDPNFLAMQTLPKIAPPCKPAPSAKFDEVVSQPSEIQKELKRECNEAIFNGMPFRPLTGEDEMGAGRRGHSLMDPNKRRRTSVRLKEKNVWAELADHLS